MVMKSMHESCRTIAPRVKTDDLFQTPLGNSERGKQTSVGKISLEDVLDV